MKCHLEEFDYVGMVERLHNPDLPEELLEAPGVQLGLVDDLDGHLLTRRNVLCQFDLEERGGGRKKA